MTSGASWLQSIRALLFKNHVLHVRDNFWGGAPEKVESWYRVLVAR